MAFGEPNYQGHFSFAHPIVFISYPDKQSCESSNLTWSDGKCITQGEDTTDVFTNGGKLGIKVLTVVTNDHECYFAGTAQILAPDQVKASTPSQEYNESTGSLVDVICEVTVTYKGTSVISVSNNGHCSEFCGVNADLRIEDAQRK